MDAARLAHDFAYHPPLDDETKTLHEEVRARHRTLADWVNENVPAGREQSLVITKIEEAMFWANAAVARAPRPGSG